MNHQPLVETINKQLNLCIRIESTKINRRASIPYQVSFCLDTQLLAQIEQIRASNSRLKLSASNLANLRHYALLNLPSELVCHRRNRQESIGNSALTFATQYLAAENHSAVTLFRSEIDIAGKISQQVQQTLCQDSLLLTQISQSHYWLVLEILAQLPLRSKTWYSWLLLGCFAIVVAIACSLIWYLTPLTYLFKIATCLCLIFCSKLVFKTLIIQQLKSWTIYHLLDGFFAKNTYKKQLGLKLLSFLICFN